MFKNYLKIAYRNLLRHKGYTAINVAGLAVGLAGSFFILLWVQDERSYDRFLEGGDRIHLVWRNDLAGEEVETRGGTSKPLAETMEAEYPEIEEAVQTTWPERFILTRGDESFREPGTYASADFFDVFAFPFIQGDPETALQGRSAVITDRLARKLFGEDWQAAGTALGRPINVDRWEGIAVTGVIADVPENSSLQFDVLLPIQGFFARNPRAEEWGVNYFPLYVKLSEGASLADVNAKVADVVNRHEEGANEVVFLQPYEDGYLHSEYENGQLVGGRIEYVRIFSVVAVFLLLIAAINFMNLATARSMERAREVGVRKAVGARQGSLVGQFLGESVGLALIAFVFALVLVFALLPLFGSLTGKDVAAADLDGDFLVGALGVALVVGLLAGSYPALYLSSFGPLAVLRGTVRQRAGSARLRKGLVVFQFALSMLLIVATVAVYAQVEYIRDRDVGLDRHNLIYLAQEGALGSQHEAVRQELLGRPGIAGVTAANANPLQVGNSTGSVSWPGKNPDVQFETYIISADYDFVETMRMELAAGRAHDRASGADSTGFVINEELTRLMGGDVVGEPLSFWGETGTVIGVVEDFDMNSIYAPDAPLIIRLAPEGTSRLYVRAEPGQTATALAGLEAVFNQFNPDYPFDYRFLDAEYEATYRSEVVMGRLANVFAVIAIFISCLGLFGLVSFMAEQRTKEMGVRKVLGASVPHIVLLLTGEVTKLVLLGIVIALPVSYYLVQEWLTDFDAHADVGVALFALAGVTALAIAWLTVSYQAVKAALADPVKSLRYE